jgi:hypothetical protein
MHEHFGTRLNELSKRLNIKSSQQATWEEYAKLIEMLAEQPVKKPSDDADTATISLYHAESATEFSRKLAKIADATSKFKAVLTEDQQTILHVLNFEWVMFHFRHLMN